MANGKPVTIKTTKTCCVHSGAWKIGRMVPPTWIMAEANTP